jgi:hypothetical protein
MTTISLLEDLLFADGSGRNGRSGHRVAPEQPPAEQPTTEAGSLTDDDSGSVVDMTLSPTRSRTGERLSPIRY